MAHPHVGTFTWRELMTPDVDKSRRFYGELLGWTTKTVPMRESSYDLVENGPAGDQVGGMMPFSKEGVPPCWMSYVSVEDVDASAKVVTGGGGNMVVPPQDIPDVGRFGVAMDPQGAGMVLFRSAHPAPQPAKERPSIGEFCWEHLSTTDTAAAAAFYARLCGWTRRPMDGDDGGLVLLNGGEPVASMRKAPPGVPAHWMTHVAVAKLGEACDRARRLGGKVLLDPMPVPGMGSVAIVQDNVGAVVGLFQSTG